ncbi:MAG: DUF4363 family protein [Clostridia bacterium]|nr:DUF4363 family protein [Clostridia bacterium]
MLKEIIISITVVISILLLNWYLQDYTKKSTLEINSQLEELKNKLKDKDEKSIEENIKQVKENWSKQYSILAMFIEHDELEKVETDLVNIDGYIEIKDYDKGINEVNKSIFSLNHIAEKYDFSLINIF